MPAALAALALAAGAGLAVPQAAHAVSSISVSSTTVAAGDTFTISFNGTADVDTPGAGENFYAGSSTLGRLSDFTTIVACTGNTAPCTSTFGIGQRVPLGDLTAGGAFSGTITLRVNPETPAGSFVLGYQLYGNRGGEATVYEPAITVTDPPPADLAVGVTAQPHLGILVPYLTYTLTAHNTGPDAVTSATVTATLPPGASATGLPAGCTTGTGTVTCTYGTIANGAGAAKSFRVPLHLFSLGQVTVTGTRTASTPADPNPANDTDSATCTVVSVLLATCP
ncbi:MULTISPECIES: DUF11 domain-containing protein [Streptomyces]|uniref:DUF11 domain-containing protein n=1 Tax=Streptomyces TaxID=1883 RepID=UPI00025CB668|nr:DUF11 domain-containing protein [Streptomyces tsukubensis]AZK92457.1 hypothetical protein B7R87_00010 [Streptomyces tsukubensis]EIF94556.1 hypothetical protein [Streptomyces tsukubensis NRRL18488]